MANTFDLHLAYIIGTALGDGNLSRPNQRATRLRITCDAQYPDIIKEIIFSLKLILPNNKVSVVTRKNQRCVDISVYSNKLNDWLPWKAGQGSKIKQNANIPNYILDDLELSIETLRGLIHTDGSIYFDRTYLMVNFVSHIEVLAKSVFDIISRLGFRPTISTIIDTRGNKKYTVRLARDTTRFLELINISKT